MTEAIDTPSEPTNESASAFNNADWFSLEQSLKDGNVIPIIGPDALLVEFDDHSGIKCTTPFYRLVAADLLKNFQLEAQAEIVEHTWALHKAVNLILANKGGSGIEQRIRREVSRLIATHSERVQPAASLRQLANIGAFSLFISLTPDNLLERAMAPADVRVNAFSPRDASEALADLNLIRQGERGIFQLLGACGNAISGFAIHEEDTLEYLYRLQSDSARRFAAILSELRRRDKLLIGCNFPDWLGRAMLRLVNNIRFYTNDKDTTEFLCPNASDVNLKAFLSQYSPNTLGFDGQPDQFIKKLAENFSTHQTSPKSRPANAPSQGPTVFVSYASENADAARRIASTLLNLGFSDVWLDQKKLIGGDDWSNRIEEAIQKCDFFMPILSKQADSRREGVFWDEWNTAVARSHRIQDVFLLPTSIEPQPARKSDYPRIADGNTQIFFDKHLLHAPDGFFNATDQDALTERCRRFLGACRG